MDARVTVPPAIARMSFVLPAGKHALLDRSINPHCLIATDDDDLSHIVNQALRQLCYTAAFVRSGTAALASARSSPSQLVLLDQALPDVAGLDVARVLGRETPDLKFVLVGTRLTTSITVEAMKLGAFTVLEKPVGVEEIVATVRTAIGETGTATSRTAHTPSPFQGAPRSIPERWALHVLKACEADGDLRTLGAWASFAGVSYSSLCESCRLVGIQPLDARDLARVLRVVVQSGSGDCRFEELLDISDRRTLRALMTRAGLSPNNDTHRISVDQFLVSQRFVPAENVGLGVLRALLNRG